MNRCGWLKTFVNDARNWIFRLFANLKFLNNPKS